MLNKLTGFVRQQNMIMPGDTVICAVSGGADSMALLWAMYLLRKDLGITLQAAHFNHGLRGAESDRDEEFVRAFCSRYQIPLFCEKAQVQAGKKGLEAAARDARYSFLRCLPGKIATAHTADDNAETVLMHLIRGTGLRGLGGISPVSGSVIRPMLLVTRQEIGAFLAQYDISWVEDSTNASDAFLRNRLRHHVMPLLEKENPSLAKNLSMMAMNLRQDEQLLSSLVSQPVTDVKTLRQMDPALRARNLAAFLTQSGVKEPESEHILLTEKLVFSENPSASACFPGGITIGRVYDTLVVIREEEPILPVKLKIPGVTDLPQWGLRVTCEYADAILTTDCFTVCPEGDVYVRSRRAGDTIRTMGGTKSLKKLFIDRKIPAGKREAVPVLADDHGVLAVYGIGANLDRHSPEDPGVCVRFETIKI